ncbi:MAG TPA: CBS domain-containing protein [Candidatus Dormibacteraeota bacterium]|nr:CBS domain-containing protein [Candidatus Dormibacteraeota bacterium]
MASSTKPRPPGEATVAAVMTRAVITISPEARVAEAAEMLHQHHITGMPVLDDHHRVVGVVSEMDVVLKPGATVAAIMSPEPRTIEEEVPLSAAAEILMAQRIRRLPVVRHGKLVGLISRTDLVTFFARHQWVCGKCGGTQRGLEPPDRCIVCGADGGGFRLEDAPGGM